jgi:molybdopterin adenylyltransferase
MKVAILTLSDKGSRGEREDLSGPALRDWLAERGVTVVCMAMMPDELEQIAATLEEWAVKLRADLILTTGGTGVSPRDLTPEATRRVIERELPGFAERMRQESLKKTPHAIISRALAGIRGETLIVNLPGSPKGAVENLAAVWPAIPHTIAKMKGDPTDCAV